MKKRDSEAAGEFAARGCIHPDQEDLTGALLWFSTYHRVPGVAPVWVPVVWLGWCEPFTRTRGEPLQWGHALFEGGKVATVHRTRLRRGGEAGPHL